MNFEEFASKHRLRVRRAEDGDHIIAGKLGHIYQHDAETLGLLFMPNRPRCWSHAKRKLEAAGLTIWQDGDDEGSALFDPANTVQARLALKVIRARPRRTSSSAQLEALAKARKLRRIAPKRCAEAVLAP
jgi:hypothetical protein